MDPLAEAKRLFLEALTLQEKGDLERAEGLYRKALTLAPKRPSVMNNLAAVLFSLKKYAEARLVCEQLLEIDPADATALLHLGNCQAQLDSAGEALISYDKALMIRPDFADALTNRGNALLALRRPGEALASHDRALAIAPGSAEALYNRGKALLELKRPEEALASYERALAIKPDYADALNNSGNALVEQGKLEQAEAQYLRAIAIQPDHAKAYSGLGVVRHDQGRMDEALRWFEQALARDGSLADAQYNLAVTRLYRQEFEAAWPGHEHRLAFADVRKLVRGNLATVTLYEQLARWQGPEQAVAGAVGIWAEQGIGDHVLYSTLIPELIASGVPFIYEVDQRLVGVYERAFPNGRFVASAEPPQEVLRRASRVMLAGSLPGLFRRSRESFSRQPRRLLSALPERVAKYRSRMDALGPGFKVALSWQSRRKGRAGLGKSLPLMLFAPLLELERVHFVDVQYGDTVAERREVEQCSGVRLLHFDEVDYFHDLEAVLAILEACDLLITTSNVSAHLAGALGMPVWLLYLAERPPFHYWAHDGSHRCLWYPSVEIVSAPHFTTWDPLIDHVKERLAREPTHARQGRN
jgi:tetratricopeptide (TPR) repeat protein